VELSEKSFRKVGPCSGDRVGVVKLTIPI
jgi:hypothetical protein